MIPSPLFLVSVLAWSAQALVTRPLGPGECTQVTIPVDATAQNYKFANTPDTSDQTAVNDWVLAAYQDLGVATNGTFEVSGTYSIAGILCAPDFPTPRRVIQLVVHGFTYNKTMWFGMGYGDEYNWPRYASARGFYTLTFDRLGHGQSEPTLDPINVIQVPLEVQVYHGLVSAVRAGCLGLHFDHLLWVGHSFGSAFGTALANAYPHDVDGYVLTGLSSSINITIFTQIQYYSAYAVYPERYAHSPGGYVVFATEPERSKAFYEGAFDPAIPVGDYRYADTLSIGEVGTFGQTYVPSTFTGPVILITGADDIFLCNSPPLSCDEILQSSRPFFFPNASFSYYIPPATGHDVTLHYSAPKTFSVAHDWIDSHFSPL